MASFKIENFNKNCLVGTAKGSIQKGQKLNLSIKSTDIADVTNFK